MLKPIQLINVDPEKTASIAPMLCRP
jgi:hypothetical protein